jgi:thiol-disulfide isomerase/thioredoxin
MKIRFLSPLLAMLLLLSCGPRLPAGSTARDQTAVSGDGQSTAAAPSAAQEASSPVAGSISERLVQAGFAIPKAEISATDFTLPGLDGKTVGLSSFRGKLVILSFWATWCGPCKQELPSIQALYEKLKGKGLTVVAVDLMEDPKTVGDFVKSYGMTFPVLLDGHGKVGGIYDAGSIPTNYLVDRKGKILARVVGYDGVEWTSPERLALFEKLLSM